MLDRKTIRVLLIEDEGDQAGITGSYLAEPAGAFALTSAPRLSTACHLLARHDFDAALIDLMLPQTVGLEGFQKVRELKPGLPIIVLAGLKDEALAVEAVKLGAQDYLIKGSPDCCLLKRAIRYAIERKRLCVVIEGLLNAEHVPPADPAAAAQIAESQAQLREGLRALEVKNHFLDLISHELRNTLATMKTAAFCLKEGVGGTLTARQTDLVAMISNNVDRQTRVIDNLIDLTDFRPGKLSFDFRQTDVRKIILDLVRELGLKSAPRELEADVDRSLPLIKGDPDLLTQVLRSLIGNALRFAKSKVVVRASAAGARGLSISVADDGEGILPERLEAKGLGLSICEEIVAGHHGKLWAESAPGKGALMSVLLPASGLAPSYAGDR